MSQPINLNRARKDRARQTAKREADANAVKFGRSKAQKQTEAAAADQRAAKLDGHRRPSTPKDA
ncbi:MAG: DUF4169 family protein [Pseudomonadota bacterium]